MDWNEEKSLNLSERYICDYQEASRVIIASGRDFDDYEYMSTKLNELLKDQNMFNNKAIKVISGMAKGADTLGIRYADEHKLTKILLPHPFNHGDTFVQICFRCKYKNAKLQKRKIKNLSI